MQLQTARRLDFYRLRPDAYRALLRFSSATDSDALDASMLDLVKLRVSQINACAWCIDMHSKEARHRGESERRLHLLSAWRDAECFGERESAALALAEAVNAGGPAIDDDAWQRARDHFGDAELADLLGTVVATIAWNRINVAIGLPPGDYRPRSAR